MKKVFYILSIILFNISLTSCSSDDDNDEDSNDSIIGKWKAAYFTDPENYDICDYNGWIHIQTGGKYTEYDDCVGETFNGKWTATDNTITVTADIFPMPVTFKIISVNETTMVLEITWITSEQITYQRL